MLLPFYKIWSMLPFFLQILEVLHAHYKTFAHAKKNKEENQMHAYVYHSEILCQHLIYFFPIFV